MPPKPKYTREGIAAVALDIVKEDGLAALTARELGRRLGTSVRPVFTYFKNMEDVKMAARELALAEFKEYISDYQEYTPAFKRIGIMMVSYGIHEPELFKLLFMQEHESETGFRNTLQDLDDIPNVCVELIRRDYGMTQEEAQMIFEQLWIQVFGMGTMCAMRVISLNDEEIGKHVSVIFAGLVMLITSGKLQDIYSDVEKKTDDTYHGMKLMNMPFAKEASLSNN